MFDCIGRVWFTADPHFGHENIIRYCNRPYKNKYIMDEALIANWNADVRPDDMVIVGGDFSFETERYIGRLNGKIILVKGNHDNKRCNRLFTGVVESLPIKLGEFNCLLRHIPIVEDGFYKKGQEPDFSIPKKYDFLITGHVHEKWKVNGNNVNIGVDQWDMKPIFIDDLIRFLRSLKT
jgi:calcineurin-like phosphoesterase family protein